MKRYSKSGFRLNHRSINRGACLVACIAACSAARHAEATTELTPTWLSAVSGNWTTAADWSSNPAYPNNSPSLTYAPVINASGSAYTVTLSSTVSIDSLTVNSPAATMSVLGGVLNVVGQGINIASGSMNVGGNSSATGTINGGTISTGSGGVINLLQFSSINGVSLGSNVSAGSSGGVGYSAVYNYLNLNGYNLTMTAGLNLQVLDSTGISGNGVITVNGLPSSSNFSSTFNGVIGPGVTIQTGTLPGGGSDGIFVGISGGTTVLQGTLLDQTPGVECHLQGNWSNTGSIKESSGTTLELAGSFTTAGLGTLTNAGGSILLTGTWNNSNSIFNLTPSIGSITFPATGGTITGGTFNGTGGAQLIVNSTFGATLANITLGANVSIAQGDTLSIVGNVNLSGSTVTLGGAGSTGAMLQMGGQSLGGTGTLLFNKGTAVGSSVIVAGSSSIGPGVTLQAGTGTGYVNGAGMNFSGTVITGISTQEILFSAGVNFGGSVTVLANGVFTAPSVTNFTAGTISNATYIINSGATLRLPGANIVTDNAAITFNGTGSSLYSDPTANTNALAGLTTIGAAGSLTITGGQGFIIAQALDDQGSITVGPSSILVVTGGLTVDHGGQLTGAGRLAGNVSNSSLVAPTGASAVLAIIGSYTQAQTGSLDISLSGPSAYDTLEIQGAANVSGTLLISTGNGFTPAQGEIFDILELSSPVGGSFTTLNLPALQPGLAWDTSQLYTAGDIKVITAVPEPGWLAIAGPLCLGGLLSRRGVRLLGIQPGDNRLG